MSQTTDSRLGRDMRALDDHAEMVAALRARDLPTAERKIRHLAPLLPFVAATEAPR